jgi:hypothetical protein
VCTCVNLCASRTIRTTHHFCLLLQHRYHRDLTSLPGSTVYSPVVLHLSHPTLSATIRGLDGTRLSGVFIHRPSPPHPRYSYLNVRTPPTSSRRQPATIRPPGTTASASASFHRRHPALLASASALHRTALPARTNSTQLSPVWYDPGDQPRLWANCTLRIYDELSHHLHLVGSVFNALLTLHHSISFASLLWILCSA